MALGNRDTASLGMLTGWDATELKKYELEDGTSFTTVAQMLGVAANGVASELYTDPIWSSLVSYTDMLEVEYRVGSSNGMGRYTEYGTPDPKRAQTEGHMLPLLAWDRGLGWTWRYLEKARMPQIQADIADAVKDVKDRYRIQLLTRLLQRGDDSGTYNGLGSSGYSPGFATAAASTSVDFTPPAYGGTAFTSDHEHYVGISGGAFTAAVFTDAKAELLEHGHEPPYNFLIGKSDESTVLGLTGFVKTAEQLVRLGDDTAVATFSTTYNDGRYAIGTISDFVVWVVPGIPQYYGVGYKSYGANSQRNPLRIRLPKGYNRPVVRVFSDPRSGAGAAYPLQYAMLFTEYGIGVADRTAATPRYVNSTTWADGSAS